MVASSSTSGIIPTGGVTTPSIDVASLVSQLIAVESQPLTTMNQQIASYQAKITTLGTIQGALSSFQTSVQALSDPSQFQQLTATSSDNTVLTASATSAAMPGSYSLSVNSLAQAQTLVAQGQTSTTAQIGSGTSTTLTFDFGTVSGSTFTSNGNGAKTITIDSTNNSLSGIASAINGANMGVTASIINDGSSTPYRLVLTSDSTGASNSMQITAAAGGDSTITNLLTQDYAGTQNLTQTVAAQNAQFTVNGTSISSNSNTVSSAISGVTLNLNQTSASAVTLNIANDTASATTAVNNFVKAYNDLSGAITNVTKYDASTNTAGVLQGDPSMTVLLSQLRSAINAQVSTNTTNYSSLAEIGATFLADGTLAVNTAQLNTVLAASPGDLAGIFAAVGSASDSLINYSSATSSSQPGSYAVNITQLATQGSTQGSVVLPSSTTITSTNNALDVTVDSSAASISLDAGTYTATELAAALQAKINGALSGSGHSVTVSITAGGALNIASDLYGSTSSVSVTSGSALSTLLGTVTQTTGQDVAGSINNTTATGQGQTLTSTVGDSTGISVNVLGGSLGSRGTIDYSQGVAYNLNNIATSLLGTSGPIASETAGLNASIANVNKQITTLNTQISQDRASLIKQYSALDAMLGTMNNLSSYLTQQLAQLPG